jgi:hypothetical protein
MEQSDGRNCRSRCRHASSVAEHGELKRAVEFGRVQFGQEPAKLHEDAKFEIEDPVVILSLVPQTPAAGTPRGQFGITVDDTTTRADPGRLSAPSVLQAMKLGIRK